MRARRPALAACLLALAATIASAGPGTAGAGRGHLRSIPVVAGSGALDRAVASGALDARVARTLRHHGAARAIVTFRGDAALAAAVSKAPAGRTRSAQILSLVRPAYAALKQRALAAVPNVRVLRNYSALPVSYVEVRSRSALLGLLNRPEVARVGFNQANRAFLAESLPLIRQPLAASNGDTGAGASVAVLDTGLDYTTTAAEDAAFGNCTSPGVPSTCKVAYAQDFAPDDTSLDDNGHGTNVSAIVVGVAPDAKVLALDVFSPGGSAFDTDIIAAINFSISNQAMYNIRAMNMSLGVGNNWHTTECSGNNYQTPFANARAVGILPVVAAGNNAYTAGNTFHSGVSSPACTPGAVRVGAVYDSNSVPDGITWGNPPDVCTDFTTNQDQVTCFSQTGPLLTLLAPGALIVAAGIEEGGTSQATPHVAGATAVLAAAAPGATVDAIQAAFQTTGPILTDPRNSQLNHRLDLPDAVAAVVGSSTGPGTLQFGTSSFNVQENGGNAVITVSRANGSDGQVTVDYAASAGTAGASDFTAVSNTLTFPDGGTFMTFNVPITNDSIHENSETVNLTLSNPQGGATLGTQTTAVLTIADDDLSQYQPDELIGFSLSTLVGEDVYKAAGGGSQTRTRSVGHGVKKTFTYYIVVSNDGANTDRIFIKGPGSKPGFSVKYTAGGTNYTSYVKAGTLYTDAGPGAYVVLKLVITVASTAPVGSKSWLIVATSSHGPKDGVVAKVKVT